MILQFRFSIVGQLAFCHNTNFSSLHTYDEYLANFYNLNYVNIFHNLQDTLYEIARCQTPIRFSVTTSMNSCKLSSLGYFHPDGEDTII